jgi:hypothetical protein
VEEEEMLLDVERELDPNTGEVVFEVLFPPPLLSSTTA